MRKIQYISSHVYASDMCKQVRQWLLRTLSLALLWLVLVNATASAQISHQSNLCEFIYSSRAHQPLTPVGKNNLLAPTTRASTGSPARQTQIDLQQTVGNLIQQSIRVLNLHHQTTLAFRQKHALTVHALALINDDIAQTLRLGQKTQSSSAIGPSNSQSLAPTTSSRSQLIFQKMQKWLNHFAKPFHERLQSNQALLKYGSSQIQKRLLQLDRQQLVIQDLQSEISQLITALTEHELHDLLTRLHGQKVLLEQSFIEIENELSELAMIDATIHKLLEQTIPLSNKLIDQNQIKFFVRFQNKIYQLTALSSNDTETTAMVNGREQAFLNSHIFLIEKSETSDRELISTRPEIRINDTVLIDLENGQTGWATVLSHNQRRQVLVKLQSTQEILVVRLNQIKPN